MFITLTDNGEITTIVVWQKSNASPGSHSILPKVIRNCIFRIASPLCDMFNVSIFNGVFPDKFKLTKVLPIYKTVDRSSL